MKKQYYSLAAICVLIVTAAASAEFVDVMLAGYCNTHAYARAELVEWHVTEDHNQYGETSAKASALAMHGYHDEYNNWIYYDMWAETQADICATTNSIYSSGSLTAGGTGPGMSDGFVDNAFSGTITIGTSEDYPLGTEGLLLNISLGGWSIFEVNSSYISSDTEIEVRAGDVLTINCMHQSLLNGSSSMSNASADFSVTPEPTTLFLFGAGGLALRRKCKV